MVMVLLPVVRVSTFELMAMTLAEPDPVTVMPLPEMVTPVNQVQVPAGMVTVSPSAAELIAACTSLVPQVAAGQVVASAGSASSRTAARNLAMRKTNGDRIDASEGEDFPGVSYRVIGGALGPPPGAPRPALLHDFVVGE